MPTDPAIKRAYHALSVTSYHQRMKLRAIEYKGGACQRCGYSKSPAALVFHHRRSEDKEFSIGRRVVKWEVLLPELEKCDLLCQNCHHEEHERLFSLQNQKVEADVRRVIPVRTTRPKVTITCSTCGKTLNRAASMVRTSVTYCSLACSGEAKVKVAWPNLDRLREMVWNTPLTALADQLGVSDVAVKKHCKKLGIETPGRGYWAKQRST